MDDVPDIEADREPARKITFAGVDTREPVLLMDDDHLLQKITTNLLDALGYRAVICHEGAEAVSLYRKARQSGTPFALAVLDIEIADGMSGVDAARHILAIDPAARLVASSGNHHHPAMTDYLDFGFRAVLPKPYRLLELCDVLEDVRLPPAAIFSSENGARA